MPLEFANITFDLADQLGVDFDPRRTKVWITTNVPGDTVIDTSGKKIRLGSGNVVLNPDGTGTLSVWKTGQTGLNPLTWQTTIHVDYPDRNKPRGRDTRSFGPFTITASVDLTDLVQQQEIPPTYVSTVTAQLDAKVTDAGAKALEAKGYRDEAATTAAGVQSAVDAGLAEIDAKIVEDLGTTDAQTKALIESSTSQTKAALSATYGPVGSSVGRFIGRARSGVALKVVALGDSILEGLTVTSGGGVVGTDDALSLLATDLSTRFGTTVTRVNHAVSGYTVARSFITGKVNAALAENADLYVIGFGKNDQVADTPTYTGPSGGYPLAASTAALERLVRLIRRDVPKADIILMSENPYDPIGSALNTKQVAYDKRVREIAATYGCEFVDVYAAFAALGSFTPLMAESTHPNKAGHRLIADTLLAHLPNRETPRVQSAQPGTTGLYAPERVNTTPGNFGYVVLNNTGTVSGVTWGHTGTWTGNGASSTPYRTSTAGSYAEWTFTGTELLVFMDATAPKAAVVDVIVDGVTTHTDYSLSSANPVLTWIAVATGLTAAAHTVRIVLKSGTLDINSSAVLAAPVAGSTFSPTTQTAVIPYTGGPAAYVDLSGGTDVSLVDGTPAALLPAGWMGQAIIVSGSVSIYISGVTTTKRTVRVTLKTAGTVRKNVDVIIPPVAEAAGYEVVVPIDYARGTTVSESIGLSAQVTSTDKTFVRVTRHYLEVTQHRTA